MNKKELLDNKLKIMKEFLKNNGDLKKLKEVQDNIVPIIKEEEKKRKK